MGQCLPRGAYQRRGGKLYRGQSDRLQRGRDERSGRSNSRALRPPAMFWTATAFTTTAPDPVPASAWLAEADGGIQAPVITSGTCGPISGIAANCPHRSIQIFSDSADQGRVYQGQIAADGNGNFSWTQSVSGPFVTSTVTDSFFNTSIFSGPYHAGSSVCFYR